jgi:hypothetical protein
MIEIRYVSKAGIQTNIQHLRRLKHQSHRRPAQPNAEKIPVRCKSGELMKNPKEMVAAKFGLPGKGPEGMVDFGMILD